MAITWSTRPKPRTANFFSTKRSSTSKIDEKSHLGKAGSEYRQTGLWCHGPSAQAVERGKVKYLGLSNVTAEEIRHAHSIHPISAVQYEYSLWRREAEVDLLPTLRELGIALVGWSPLGGGFLTGTIEKLSKDDFRQNNPRYTGSNIEANRNRFSPLMDLAESMNITPALLALAWLLHQGTDIFPIPGSRKKSRIDENADSLDVKLDARILETINDIAKIGAAAGATLIC